MFHHQDKLKDLKVEFRGGAISQLYSIKYKDELADIRIIENKPTEYSLTYKEDSGNSHIDRSHHIVVGEGNLKRDVWHFSTPDGPLPTLRCGYTSHIGNNTWSSTPHPFEDFPEKGFEEVFLYLISGKGHLKEPTAIQTGVGVWQDGTITNNLYRVKDRDISAIPMGYHPVVGEPGVHVSYIWAYLAKKKEWEKI